MARDTWDLTTPASGDTPANFAGAAHIAINDKTALSHVLGTLVPLGTPTVEWRVVQDDNIVYVVTNAIRSAHNGNFTQDDVTKDSYGILLDPTTNNSIRVLWAPAGFTPAANPWLVLGEFPKVASAVNFLQVLASATAAPLQLVAAGTDTNIPIQITPKGTGTLTLGAPLLGTSAPALSATGGYPYLSAMAGVPSGAPVTQTGYAPIVIDTTDSRLYFYSGAAWNVASGAAPQMQAFTTSATYTTPTGAKAIWVRMVGGGGGGGGGSSNQNASGGAAGGYSEIVVAGPVASYVVTIGAAGSAGSGGGNGGAGGNSTFGAVLTCNGGGAGLNNGNPPAGGTASGGTLNLTGQAGGIGGTAGGSASVPGGNSVFGGAGNGSPVGGGQAAAPNSGSGGSGGAGAGNAGGAGGAGLCLVVAYF